MTFANENAMRELASAVRSIASGGVEGPGGLEGLTMVFGRPGEANVVDGLLAISGSIERLAVAVESIAEALEK